MKAARYLALLALILVVAPGVRADEKKVQQKLHRAELEFQRGNVGGAEKLLRDVLKDEPSSIEAHNMLANLLASTRRNSQAAVEYGRVLALDADQKLLSPQEKRNVIDGQAVGYAESGDLDRAKSIYLGVLKEDPDYALYNYNLACVYAELHDLDSAIPYLKKSWEKRDTLPPNAKFPDPRQDRSFASYFNDPKFQDAVRHMVQ